MTSKKRKDLLPNSKKMVISNISSNTRVRTNSSNSSNRCSSPMMTKMICQSNVMS